MHLKRIIGRVHEQPTFHFLYFCHSNSNSWGKLCFIDRCSSNSPSVLFPNVPFFVSQTNIKRLICFCDGQGDLDNWNVSRNRLSRSLILDGHKFHGPGSQPSSVNVIDQILKTYGFRGGRISPSPIILIPRESFDSWTIL